MAEVRESTSRYGNLEVYFICEDGTDGTVPFFSDEISLSERDAIGRTPDQLRETKVRRDVAYLRS